LFAAPRSVCTQPRVTHVFPDKVRISALCSISLLLLQFCVQEWSRHTDNSKQ
jgi:hypothetical protein